MPNLDPNRTLNQTRSLDYLHYKTYKSRNLSSGELRRQERPFLRIRSNNLLLFVHRVNGDSQVKCCSVGDLRLDPLDVCSSIHSLTHSGQLWSSLWYIDLLRYIGFVSRGSCNSIYFPTQKSENSKTH